MQLGIVAYIIVLVVLLSMVYYVVQLYGFSNIEYVVEKSPPITLYKPKPAITMPSSKTIVARTSNVEDTTNTVTTTFGEVAPRPRINNWLKIIGRVLALIVSAIASIIEYLFNLTVIKIPMPKIGVYEEANVSVRVGVGSLIYSIVVIGAIVTVITIVAYLVYKRKHRLTYPLTPIYRKSAIKATPKDRSTSKQSIKANSLEELLLRVFKRLVEYGKNRLGLNESVTPRELALKLDETGLGDDVWVIEAAIEELRYGGRSPNWLSLSDALSVARRIEEKIND